MRLWLVVVLLLACASAVLGSIAAQGTDVLETSSGELVDLDDTDDDDWAIESPAVVVVSQVRAVLLDRALPQLWLFESGIDRPPCSRA